jgi:hypothetical protein
MWTVFAPVNVALHAMSLEMEMEMGEAAEALRLADCRVSSSVPSPRTHRRSGHWPNASACWPDASFRTDKPAELGVRVGVRRVS